MKSTYLSYPLAVLLLAASMACVSAGPPGSPASRSVVTVEVFYDGLAPHGTWIDLELYGWVWVPAGVPPGWRPYTYGRWIYTSLGWTWVSDWAWGWAPFHYGRWVHRPPHGWLWIPGRVWSPAWVAWRVGDGWIGWAPLPPPARWRPGSALGLGDIDLGVVIASDWWVFVGESQFLAPRLHQHVAAVTRNPSLRATTREVTRYALESGWVAERGVPVDTVERVDGAVPRYRIEDTTGPSGAAAERVGRSTVEVYRPRIESSGAKRTRPPAERKSGRDGGS